jgi:uncharacterized heparinase superfamily protein
MLSQLGLISRTLPFLRLEQLVYRPLRLLQYRSYRLFPFLTRRWTRFDQFVPRISANTLSEFRRVFETKLSHFVRPAREAEKQLVQLKCGEFLFLNQPKEITEPDWNVRYVSHLWNYQFHYHDYIVGLMRAWVENDDFEAKQRAKKLIESWITMARVGVSDGWDAYPLSLRTVNWIYAYALLAESEPDSLFLKRWRTSIFQQLDFLSYHLEKHLLANHLFKNVKALVIGGLFFVHTERGQEWLTEGERRLADELAEQVLVDGGHYERAPMYHAQTLGDALECYALLKAFGRVSATECMRARLVKMARYLAALSYVDGSLALFNDSANAVETRPIPLLEAVSRVCGEAVSSSTANFTDSGYYVWQSADQREKIVVDAGELSVTYNTAHAHCDMLSYELWMNGAPLVVDSGVHGYGGDEFREYCRSTRAHNTVMVDDVEQSEVWGTFRVARRAKVIRASATENAQGWQFEGEAQGYGGNGLRHLRSVKRFASGEWEVKDQLSLRNIASVGNVARSFIHLHPAVRVSREGNNFLCETENGKIVIEPFGEVTLELVAGALSPQVQGWWFPEFGVAMRSATIVLRFILKKENNPQVIGYRIKRLS